VQDVGTSIVRFLVFFRHRRIERKFLRDLMKFDPLGSLLSSFLGEFSLARATREKASLMALLAATSMHLLEHAFTTNKASLMGSLEEL